METLKINKKHKNGQDIWTKQDVAYVLSELNAKITRMDYDTLITNIANDLDKKISSTKMVISMTMFVQSNGEMGLSHVTEALIQATNEFIDVNGTKLFTHRL